MANDMTASPTADIRILEREIPVVDAVVRRAMVRWLEAPLLGVLAAERGQFRWRQRNPRIPPDNVTAPDDPKSELEGGLVPRWSVTMTSWLNS